MNSTLPPLFSAWMSELLGGDIPSETSATCNHCAMLAQDGLASQEALVFRPDTKCCTYLPMLSNFLVGRIL
ncbi:MAG TPA: hypothetical protein VI685_13515, partial [Candidatus Angelobacter sp.]